MAARFFGINFGQSEFSVSDAATTGSKDVEVQVNLSNIPVQAGGGHHGNNDVIVALSKIVDYLTGKATTVA